MQKSLLRNEKPSFKSCSPSPQEIWHCLCLPSWPVLCSHQSAPFPHEILLCFSRSMPFHEPQGIARKPWWLSVLGISLFPLSWHVAFVQICSLKRAGASVKWITGSWQIPKAIWKMSGFWQADCPLKREFHQSWTSLHLRASHNLWNTYMLHFYPQHGQLCWKQVIPLYHSFNVP